MKRSDGDPNARSTKAEPVLSLSILATCRSCGTVRLERDALSVVVSRTGDGVFLFRCPSCGRLNTKSCDQAAVARLAAAGVRVLDLGHGAKFGPEEVAPAFDLLRCTQQLREEDFLVRLIAHP
jgi:uncharacterized Zn finger protein